MSGTPRHGHCRKDWQSPTYKSWQSMLWRVRSRPEYRERGIDPRWFVFESFLADMGERPMGKTLERNNNARGYFPDNCRWATPTAQARNRSTATVGRYRVLQILWLLECGARMRDVWEGLGISPRTVRRVVSQTHRRVA